MLNKKNVFVLGMARSGYQVAKLLASNNKVLITDAKEQDEEHVNELKSLGVEYCVTDKPEDLLNDHDIVIKNPGIRNDHPVVLKATELKIPVVNEVEVSYHYLPKDITIIGITGSNGKTTTTTIIYEILKEAKKPVHVAGNIGYPLASFIGKVKSGDILVIEISSHQLANFNKFKTDISLLTNLSEAHLDFFGTYDIYVKNKGKIFNNQTKVDLAIINFDNEDCLNLTENIIPEKTYFSLKDKQAAYFENDAIYYQNEKVIDVADIKIKGSHNYENIMGAIMVVKEFNVDNSVINKVLKEFGGVEHRIEYVTEIKGRKFYNDSKSTNVNSTQIALSSFKEPTILLLGGLNRDLPFDDLKDYLMNVKAIICYGETKNIIKSFADDNNIECHVNDTLEESVKLAYDISQEGDVILLSPACASWDQFKDFEERGNVFKEVINNLKKDV